MTVKLFASVDHREIWLQFTSDLLLLLRLIYSTSNGSIFILYSSLKYYLPESFSYTKHTRTSQSKVFFPRTAYYCMYKVCYKKSFDYNFLFMSQKYLIPYTINRLTCHGITSFGTQDRHDCPRICTFFFSKVGQRTFKKAKPS